MSGAIGISAGAPHAGSAAQLQRAHALAALAALGDAKQALHKAQAVVDTDRANHSASCVRQDQPAVDLAAAQVAQAQNAAQNVAHTAAQTAALPSAPAASNAVDPEAAPGPLLSLVV